MTEIILAIFMLCMNGVFTSPGKPMSMSLELTDQFDTSYLFERITIHPTGKINLDQKLII
jgi:hypothetical protein